MAPGTTDFGHLLVLTLILKDTQLDHTHLAVQHRHFGWYIMLVEFYIQAFGTSFGALVTLFICLVRHTFQFDLIVRTRRF